MPLYENLKRGKYISAMKQTQFKFRNDHAQLVMDFVPIVEIKINMRSKVIFLFYAFQ
jgi:hypothetical protein